MEPSAVWCILPVAFLACGEEARAPDAGSMLPDSADGPPVIVDPYHMPERLSLGVGFRSFDSIADGDEVELVRGPQSLGRYFGYHIWLSVRARGYAPEMVDLDFKVENVDTSTTVGDTVFEYNLSPIDGEYGATGLRALIRDCCLAEHAHLLISVELVDADGHRGRVERPFVAGPCAVPGGAPLCP